MRIGLGLGLTLGGELEPPAPDETAPVLTMPHQMGLTTTTASIGVTTDEGNGTLYWYVSTSDTEPSQADLIAGTGAAAYGNAAVSSTGMKMFMAEGLTPDTTYYAYFLHIDAADNASNIASFSFATEAELGSPVAPVLTQTSDVGANPLRWSAEYTDLAIDIDYLLLRWRVDGGSWVNHTPILVTSDLYYDGVLDASLVEWPEYLAAAPFPPGALVEVQEGVDRNDEVVWSDILSDEMAATAPALPQSTSIGLWLEAEPANLFQSNAGSTAVAADGDPVGFWNDLSANNFDLTSAANDTTRPTYKVSGGVHWVEFDGSNDVLRRLAALDLWNASGYTVMVAMRPLSPTANKRLIAQGNGSETNTIFSVLGAGTTGGSDIGHFYRSSSGANVLQQNTVTGGFGSSDIVVTVVDDGGSVDVYVDGTKGSNRTYTRSGNTFNMNRFALGAMLRTTLSDYFPARVHGLAIWPGVVLDSTERAAARTYFAALQGRTL